MTGRGLRWGQAGDLQWEGAEYAGTDGNDRNYITD